MGAAVPRASCIRSRTSWCQTSPKNLIGIPLPRTDLRLNCKGQPKVPTLGGPICPGAYCGQEEGGREGGTGL